MPFLTKTLFIFLLVALTTLLSGCGSSADEKTASAILSAQIALTNRDCDSALSTLLTTPPSSSTDTSYISTLASAYACKAGFSEPTFFGSDITLLTTPAPLGGAVRMSTSLLLTPTNHKSYDNLWLAINKILYAGGLDKTKDQPTTLARSDYFSSVDNGNLDAQLLYMLFAALGQYMAYYGNSVAGVKGDGSYGNTCFLNYTATPANSAIIAAGSMGKCIALGTGSSAMGSTGSLSVSKMCEGVVLLNSILDVLGGVVSAVTGSTFSSISSLTGSTGALITALQAAATAAGISVTNVIGQQNQTLCESTNASNTSALEFYFLFTFERLIL